MDDPFRRQYVLSRHCQNARFFANWYFAQVSGGERGTSEGHIDAALQDGLGLLTPADLDELDVSTGCGVLQPIEDGSCPITRDCRENPYAKPVLRCATASTGN